MMAEDIEVKDPVQDQVDTVDKERRKYLTYHLYSLLFLIFVLLVSDGGEHEVFWVFLFLTQVPLIYLMVKLSKKIKDDSELDSALNNELVQLHRLQSWRNAFIASIGSLFILTFMFTRDIVYTEWIAMVVTLVGIAAYIGSFLYLDGE